jgi:putative Mg2+ transporter-C (MgtC) family protein
MLVAGSAALLTALGEIIVPNFGVSPDLVRADPVRIIEAVITGISFLGAGTIIRRKAEVEGLTTASSLLFAAALGICVALTQFIVAIGATAIVLLTLRVVKWFEKRVG